MLGRERYPGGECGAFAKAAIDLQTAAMLFENLNGCRQAKPGAKALRCKERFENFWNLLFGNARPVVGNVDLNAPLGFAA